MLISAIVLSLLGVQEPAATEAEMWKRLTYYYLDPNPIEAIGYLESINEAYVRIEGKSLADMSERGGMRSFYAEVLESSPEAVRILELRLPDLPVDVRVFANAALMRCNSPECDRVRGFPVSSEVEPLSVSALDDYWAAFTATGERSHVEKVIAALPLVEVRGDIERLLIGGAARWSLSSNAHQHTKVLEICKDVLTQAKEPLAKLLAEVIAEAEVERQKSPVEEPIKGEI